MRNTKLLLIALLGLTLMVGVAACGDMSGTSGDTRPVEPAPGSGNVPGAPPVAPKPGQPEPGKPVVADPVDLAAALALFGATERIAADIITPKCGQSQGCLDELQKVVAYCAKDATTAVKCPESMAKFAATLTAAQRSGQAPLQTTFPQVKDVNAVLVLVKEAPAAAVEVPAADVVAVITKVGETLAADGSITDVDWETVKTEIAKVAPPEQAPIIVEQIEEQLGEMAEDPVVVEFVDGKQVPVADVVTLLTKVADAIGKP